MIIHYFFKSKGFVIQVSKQEVTEVVFPGKMTERVQEIRRNMGLRADRRESLRVVVARAHTMNRQRFNVCVTP